MTGSLVAWTELTRGPAVLTIAATGCLGMAWVLARGAGRRSAEFRAQIWLAGFAAILIWMIVRLGGVTIVAPILPAKSVRVVFEVRESGPMLAEPGRRATEVRADASPPTFRVDPLETLSKQAHDVPQEQMPPNWRRLIGLAWLSGVGVVLLRIIAGGIVLQRSLGLTRPIPSGNTWHAVLAVISRGDSARLEVKLHPGVNSPISFGLRTWWILLPLEAVDWSETRVRMVLAHELAHGQRRDQLAILFIRLVTALCWFHPLAWFGLRRFRLLCEAAADDRALDQVEASTYADELFRLVHELRPSPAFLSASTLSIGQPATIRHRIASLLDPTRDRRRLSARVSLGMFVCAAVAAVLIPAVRPVRAQNAASNAANPASPRSEPMAKFRSETKELKISVRDEQGTPIGGAEIGPSGCRAILDPGSWYGWNEAVPKDPVKTDDAGMAILRVPKFVFEDLETSGITATVSRPDFCPIHAEISVANPQPVTLLRGAAITVKAAPPADASGQLKVCVELFPANGWDDFVEWKRMESGGGVVGQVPPGGYVLRAVAFDDGGKTYFSEPVAFQARKGEAREVVLPVKPGIAVQGTLSAAVPTPVTHGRVMAQIVSMVSGNVEVSWRTSAPIRSDGTFELSGPAGSEMEIVALCDGYVSPDPSVTIRGEWNATRPQNFAWPPAQPIVISMEKTGSAVVQATTPDGQPLADAAIAFWPNQTFGNGSDLLGRGFDQGTYLQWNQIEARRDRQPEYPVPSWRVRTNAKGFATIPNLPPGMQDFLISADAWEMPVMITNHGRARRQGTIEIKAAETSSISIQMTTKGSISLSEQTKKTESIEQKVNPTGESGLIDQSHLTGIPFPVTPGKDLIGRVVDESGAPLSGVLVDAWTWCPGNETKTDREGHFRLSEPGDENGRNIEVRFSLAEFSPVHVTRQPVGALGKDVVLSKRPYFEGVVTDSKGQPLPDQLIRATCGEKQADGVSIDHIWAETRADAQGHYRLHVFPDTYRVEVRSAQGEVARLEKKAIGPGETPRLDIALVPGSTFRAQVVDAATGQPVAGVRFSHWQHPGIEGTSDDQGEVAISGMFPGEFEFDVDAEKAGYRRWWSQEALNQWERKEIEKSGWQRNFDGLHFVIAKDAKPVRIEVEKGVRIRGIVRSPDGHVVKGATVAPARTGSGNSLTGDTRFSVRSKEDGSFEMLLPASNGVSYNLVAHDGGYQEWRTYANGVLPPIITKPRDEIDGVEIFLTPASTIRGTVVDESGKPVAGREVRAASSDMWENRYYFPTTRTQPDGSFELRHVRAGKQLIQAAPFWLDPKENPPSSSKEVEATSERATSDIVLTVRLAD